MIKAVHHVQISIPVGAEDNAREFYCGILGFAEIPKPESLAGRGGFWLELGGQQIHFGTEDGVDRAKTKGHVAYLVVDLDGPRSYGRNSDTELSAVRISRPVRQSG